MRRRTTSLCCLTVVFTVLVVSVEPAAAQMRFFVDRDVGLNGVDGEQFTNTGASERVRGAKLTQHAALFDWDTEPIKALLDANPGFVVTFHIYPLGTPGTDVLIETVESQNDWVEGDDAQGGCCGQFGWSPDTAAVTHEFAQTFYLPGPTVDLAKSVPWLNDEDGSPYTLMNRGGGGMALPNFTNSAPFALADWVDNQTIGVELDDVLVDDLLNNPDNRGLRLAARRSGSNWRVAMREMDGGMQAAFLELGPASCRIKRTVAQPFYLPGETLSVTLRAERIAGETTITETFPDGLTVADAGGGMENGNTITFTVNADGDVSYVLGVPADFCEEGTLRGSFVGEGDLCEGEVSGTSTVSCALGCGALQESAAIPAMLIIGPIDAGGDTNQNGLCDDNGNLKFTDYLTDGNTDETTLEVVVGDELQPDFGGEAGGVGVAFAPNPDINPRAAEGILTVWIADADADGRINLNDADNLGTPLDDFIIYSLVYLENTTNDDLPVTLLVGSNDAVKVRVNGELAHLNAVCRGVGGVNNADRVPVTLEPGINSVLIAVVERDGGTDVRLLVYDEPGLGPLTDGSVIACLVPEVEPPSLGFVRGDADSNGSINLTDGIVILNFLFLGAAAPACVDAADTDDDGGQRPTLTDAVIIFSWLFSGGVPPAVPSPDGPNYVAENCGPDVTDDAMDCVMLSPVCQ